MTVCVGTTYPEMKMRNVFFYVSIALVSYNKSRRAEYFVKKLAGEIFLLGKWLKIRSSENFDENVKISGGETFFDVWPTWLKQVIGNFAYRKILFYKKAMLLDVQRTTDLYDNDHPNAHWSRIVSCCLFIITLVDSLDCRPYTESNNRAYARQNVVVNRVEPVPYWCLETRES